MPYLSRPFALAERLDKGVSKGHIPCEEQVDLLAVSPTDMKKLVLQEVQSPNLCASMTCIHPLATLSWGSDCLHPFLLTRLLFSSHTRSCRTTTLPQ